MPGGTVWIQSWIFHNSSENRSIWVNMLSSGHGGRYLHLHGQTGSGAHPASCAVSAARGQNVMHWVSLYLHVLLFVHGVVLKHENFYLFLEENDAESESSFRPNFEFSKPLNRVQWNLVCEFFTKSWLANLTLDPHPLIVSLIYRIAEIVLQFLILYTVRPQHRIMGYTVHTSLRSIFSEIQNIVPSRQPGFYPGSNNVRFVVDKMALGQASSESFGFPCQFSFHQMFHTNLSSGTGTVGQLVADVPSGFSLIPLHET
jgi:cytochrome b subunit of formate dehydrogenase